MTEKKNKDGKKHFQIEPPTTEDFERLVICDFFYRGGWITKKEYDELLSLLNQSKGKAKEND